MKVRVYAVYKCPLCGRLITTGPSQEVDRETLPELCGRVVHNQQFDGNPWLHKVPMNVPCKCPDGSCGLAQFAGFKRC